MSNESQSIAKRDEGQAVDVRGTPPTVMSIFGSASFKRQVAAALPQHIRVESLMRIAMTEVRKNPRLEQCTPASFMGALLTCAQLGLRPGYNGEGWLIPRWNGKTKTLEAQFQPGYRGLAQLAYRSGEVSDLLAEAVYKADHFVYQLGSSPKIEHIPDPDAEHRNEDIMYFYAVISLVNGGRIMKVLRRAEVDEVRDRFAGRDDKGRIVGPWKTDYEPMGCKTALLRVLKFAPLESERLNLAIKAEEDALFGGQIAAGVVDTSKPVAQRVAERIGATVDADTGEVLEGEVVEEAHGGTETGLSGDETPVDVPVAAEDAQDRREAEEQPPGAGAAEFRRARREEAAERLPSEMAADVAAKAAERAAKKSITAAQANKVYTQCTIAKISDDELYAWLGDVLGVATVEAIPAARLGDVLAWVKGHKAEAGA